MTGEDELFARLAAALPRRCPLPARPEAVAGLEAEVGHRLPPLMRRIYTELADGGWGPSYGVLGVDHGHTDDLGGRIPEVYRTWHTTEGLDPHDLVLPEAWVPFLHAGCAMHYCVDASTPRGRVVLMDPNPGAPLKQCLVWQTSSFAEFLRLWLDDELDAVVWPSG